MRNKHDSQHLGMQTIVDEGRLAEDYVWATNDESKRHALSLYLIGSIVHKHRGTVQKTNSKGRSHIILAQFSDSSMSVTGGESSFLKIHQATS